MTPRPPIPAVLWDQVPPAAQAALGALIQHYEQRLQDLQQQIDELRQRLDQNSTNSSRPPSTDPPSVKRQPPRTPSGRPAGGQLGHPRQVRPLLPPDATLACKPVSCRRCQQVLQGEDPTPLRHQVLELPRFKPTVTEYQLHRLACPRCGTTTCAALPAGVPRGGQGPRLQATVALLTGAYRLSKRQVEQLLADLLDVPLCPGQVCALEQQTGAALAPVVAELKQELRRHDVNMDETSWREGKRRPWLWVAVTAYLTVYHLVASRGADVVAALLGAGYRGVLTSDRFKAYNGIALPQRQACWAHLRRDFQAMIDRGGVSAGIGADLLLHADILFELWYKVRDGTRSRAWLRRHVAGWLRDEFRLLLQRGGACRCAKTAGTCAEILKVEETLWTFSRVEGVEPTNNAAERALRHAVLWRSVSHGTRSAAGAQYVANILSVVETCRQQGRQVLDYLTACCQAVLDQSPAPSLLPQPGC